MVSITTSLTEKLQGLHQILNKTCFCWPSKIDNICYIDYNILCNPLSGGALWHGDLCKLMKIIIKLPPAS